MNHETALDPSARKTNAKASRKPKKVTNPLQAGIVNFFASQDRAGVVLELKDIPKRYTRYGSLLLLGPTFLIHSQAWSDVFNSMTTESKSELFHSVIQAFGDTTLTHIAINAPIAASRKSTDCQESNEIRSPVNLLPVYGDFGPGSEVCDAQHPTMAGLDTAYWTNTIQLNGIVQVWAPRWTMFSRGNIVEKSRILQAGLSSSPFPGLHETDLGQAISKIEVVDFYVGIGYFAFCYLARGVARVWGWEINGWSVEGLRRGCLQNGWLVRVVRVDNDGTLMDGLNIRGLVKDIRQSECTQQAIKCVVFWGDNKWAPKILHEIGLHMNEDSNGSKLNIRHCNLGLLPTSEGSWRSALDVLNPDIGGWLHVHENVDASAIPEKKQYIETRLQDMKGIDRQNWWSAACCHVEQVKTFAPGVVHCVYDIHIYPSK